MASVQALLGYVHSAARQTKGRAVTSQFEKVFKEYLRKNSTISKDFGRAPRVIFVTQLFVTQA
jgi:hypothetical protein